ncbi:MAG TPA: 4a-hydroxytetrahydrobiopterin dehydratase [Gemmatimonadales bacterium]|nr:4a-hydroxytetrahydrobiopterin dehydratase [Gemmatimonadales bacterium]
MKTNEPVHGGAALKERLHTLPHWTTADGWLVREFTTDGWRTTMMLVNAIAFVAEAANHHPDLEVHWSKVVVRLQTHSAGGITDKDLQLAERIEATATWRPAGGFPGLEGQSSGWVTR